DGFDFIQILDQNKDFIHLRIGCKTKSSKIYRFAKENNLKGFDIDYEHQSLKNEKAPAAGWIKELYLENDALMAKAEFNEEAKKY
ncbi:phage protease, partial [Campylobacter jejuni]|uniref:phage protease n=1 Tax=Campylobacter jejuni TaxID=197 RepID=UPI002F266A9B